MAATKSPSHSSFSQLLESWFISSVQQAMQEYVQEKKALVIYNSSGNNDWLIKWFSPIFHKVSRDKCVWLKVVTGTEQFRYFQELFPNVKVPSICCIKEGQLIDSLYGEDAMGKFVNRLVMFIDASTPLYSERPNISEPFASPSLQSLSATSHLGAGPAETNNESSSREYQARVRRHQKLADEERKRISKLVEADAREREILRKERSLRGSSSDNKIVDHSAKESSKRHMAICTLLIKLTNGVSLKHEFNPTDTLNNVRLWVDANRTDGDHPYQFYRNIFRETFTDSQESKTLEYLELTPRSALILKPVQNEVVTRSIRDAQGPGVLLSALQNVTYWWYRSQNPTSEALASRPISQTDASSPTSSMYVSPAQSPLLGHVDSDSSEMGFPPRGSSPNVYHFENTANDDKDREPSSYTRNTVNFKDS
ncbi:UBX domain-containing protein Ecym_6306 [Eremothecium cymbalariae DBVPG|uniref:UBX domain-containing protein n=1 Tax=Eremothecium cymbalariae (strain CBS 270.75 / DBVPG 7215 / KCTC 17166 / NRRL Y-17582) TaxID=931890 RepID=G8JUA6_ERECY|nr:hypothetical protein Ecym_6306 [Eremothecium cymbalariae DBVPG\